MLDTTLSDDFSRLKSGSNFLGILNDIKRRPEDAAEELGISLETITAIIEGKSDLSYEIIERATKIWPVNKRDFFIIEDDCPQGIKIMTAQNSEKSKCCESSKSLLFNFISISASRLEPISLLVLFSSILILQTSLILIISFILLPRSRFLNCFG